MSFTVSKHSLVPKHSKVSDAEKQRVFAQYGVTEKELPKMAKSDPAIAALDAQPGDVIKIERSSQTAGVAIYYRVVANG